jgi:hypothetical protein
MTKINWLLAKPLQEVPEVEVGATAMETIFGSGLNL